MFIANVNAMNLDDETINSNTEIGTTAMSFLQDCHLSQEVALIVLDTAQTLANQIAVNLIFLVKIKKIIV